MCMYNAYVLFCVDLYMFRQCELLCVAQYVNILSYLSVHTVVLFAVLKYSLMDG